MLDDATNDVIAQYTRVYILTLIERMFTPDTFSSMVHSMHLPLLSDLMNCPTIVVVLQCCHAYIVPLIMVQGFIKTILKNAWFFYNVEHKKELDAFLHKSMKSLM